MINEERAEKLLSQIPGHNQREVKGFILAHDDEIRRECKPKPITFEEAESMSKRCDYAMFAVAHPGTEINWGDAAGFFLEGYIAAIMKKD